MGPRKRAPRTPEKDELEAFDAFGNSIYNWIDDFASSYGCAKLLIAHSVMFGQGAKPPFPLRENHIVRGAALLRAFSMECLFKGLWLRRGNDLARNGHFVPVPGIDNHDLVALADKTEFPLSPEEREFLERLTLWGIAGRYPIERHVDEMATFHSWSDGFEQTLEAIVRRLLEAARPREEVG